MREKTRNTAEIILPHVIFHLDRVAKKVLGKRSADYAMDLYTAYEKMCDELLGEYEGLKRENRWLWCLVIVLFIVSVVLYSRLTYL